jgi:hypothetical protein
MVCGRVWNYEVWDSTTGATYAIYTKEGPKLTYGVMNTTTGVFRDIKQYMNIYDSAGTTVFNRASGAFSVGTVPLLPPL